MSDAKPPATGSDPVAPPATEASDTDRTSAVDDAFARHREQVDRVLAAGDPRAIKRLYVELGDLLSDAVGERVEDTPVLSLPETGPVVLGLLAGIRGFVLDAGCGPNPAMSIALAGDAERKVVAVDIGFGLVRLARSVAWGAGVPLLCVVADVEALPFRDGTFAGAVCDDTIEHLPDDERGAASLARVMEPGGRAVIATPNRHSLEVLWRKINDRIHGRRFPPQAYYAASSHLREYTWRELDRVLRPSFRVRARSSVGWDGDSKRRLATRLTRGAVLRHFSRMLVVACEPRPESPRSG